MAKEIEKILTGELYNPGDEEIMKEQIICQMKLYEFNNLSPIDFEKRKSVLKKCFKEIGENTYIEIPLRANFGCAHCHFGDFVYANFNLTLVDDGEIFVGDHTMIGPNVTIATACHPIESELRMKALQYNLPVHIGKNCWIASNVTILPGVTIGNNTIIGAGSIVTKNMPSDSICYGNPCKFIRKINQKEKDKYIIKNL